MRIDKFTYKQTELYLYDITRISISKKSNALIDTFMTKHNETYVHDCLKPIKDEPAIRKKTKDGTKYYRKDKDGNMVEYQIGQTIANYHNSQVKNKYDNARMIGDTKQLSKAIGFIITLPKNYIEGVILDFANIKKLDKHKWTNDEMEKAKEFLFTAKDCVLDEMGIRNEDVLFYSLHFDESFPHLHVFILPTVEKIYEQDVYSKKKKKDGTYTLLHKKGETEISYSVAKFYEKNKEGEYTFFKDFHQNIVNRMTTKGFDASGLINGITNRKNFNPKLMSKKQREESIKQFIMGI